MLRITDRTKKECYQLYHLTYFFPVIEQRHTDMMDLANFLLRHWGSRYVLLSKCVYYLIPVGHSAFGFPCDNCFASYILLQWLWRYCEVVVVGMKVEWIALFPITCSIFHDTSFMVLPSSPGTLPQIRQQLLRLLLVFFFWGGGNCRRSIDGLNHKYFMSHAVLVWMNVYYEGMLISP